ncbi:MAG TPA: translation initiation factor IF-2 [Pyrinomonadaceae bacterium]|nr:translation initiation factor IF-2 [Pyrinomonadaceae bacterium]
MSVATSKVRLYDLAKELKIDTKRLIEEVRREGVDVSVPSNSVSKELAEKIREKYFPKQAATAKRAIKVVKKAARVIEEPSPVEEPPAIEAPIEAEAPAPEEIQVEEPEEPAKPLVTRVIKKLAPAVRAPEPEIVPPTAQAAPAEAEIAETDAPPAPVPQPAPPPGRQVRVLRPTAAALSQGIRPGERAPAPPPSTAPARERNVRRVEYTGTPGETATPQTTYIPPPDTGRRRSRRSAPRGGKRAADGKGKLDRDFVAPQEVRTLEERIAGRLQVPGDASELKPVRLVEGSTVKEFAEKLGIKPKDVVTLLLQRGVFATINQALNDDVAADLGKRFGYDVTFVPFEEMVAEEEFEELIAADADDIEVPRAPVVTVMGHVDHGKTSLLDAIRATNVVAGEAGGITQHIGAYSVEVTSPDNGNEKRRVVFLDTPGHEAFTLMRARGAKATDVVVLVVAADDGVMPQTIEAIEHSRAAGVPIVVAINKVDKPDSNPDRVRQELSQQGLNAVSWGGDTEMVEVSAKQRKNLDTLLETILLTADILNLRASTTRLASGVVLEAKLDRGRGSVATVLVQQGTLRLGDPFIIGQIFGKVRAMFNDLGEPVDEAGPATPVEVLGLQGVPEAGESFQVVADVSRAQQISHHRQYVERQRTLIKSTKRGIEALGETEVKELLVIIKADVQGSVEVLKSTLEKMSTERVKVKVIRSGVGAITESDVLLASATQAGSTSSAVVIIGFNVRPESRAGELAKQESVDIRLHSIIYKVEEEIKAAMIGMLEKIEKEKILGKADVREVFRVPKIGSVAGCMVVDGIITRKARARLIRDGVVTWEGNIGSLRRFKDDVAEVREGFECGIGLENFNDIKVSDQIEAYIIERVAATEL